MSKIKQTAFLLMNFLEAVSAGLLFLLIIAIVLLLGPLWLPIEMVQKILKNRENK